MPPRSRSFAVRLEAGNAARRDPVAEAGTNDIDVREAIQKR